MKRKTAFLLIIMLMLLFTPTTGAQSTWRSTLYPADWQPEFTDSEGRFLHDFSYAGYHMGEKPIPENLPGTIYNVTDAAYGADNTGTYDATAAIQSAIDAAQMAGGGIVYLPAGTYRVRPPEGKNYVLNVSASNIVIKGDGASTRIYNDATYMRNTSIVNFCPDGFVDWNSMQEINVAYITKDIVERDTIIHVDSVDGFSVGDWILLKNTPTAEFIAEHGQTGIWNSAMQPLMFYRRIVGIDSSSSTLTVDIPIRYKMKTRDQARLFKVSLAHLTEVGIQDMSFGMLENTKPGTGEEDYNKIDTAAYECHNAMLINMKHTVNGWVKNISTYRPVENKKDVHILSCGINIAFCRNITVTETNIQRPLYEGGGGNGYLHTIKGQDCLFINCYANHGRHNFDFGGIYTSGNVVTASRTEFGYKESDLHMHLSPANLFDNMYVNGDQLESINRNKYGSKVKHGHSSTQSVFWNTYGNSYQSGESSIVESQQFGWGYVIGTRGPAAKVSVYGGNGTEPIDFVEGEGMADTLDPQSLYLDQLDRRLTNYSRPYIMQTFPQSGSKLFINSDAYVEFDKDMDEKTVTDKSNITVQPDVNYELSYDANKKRCNISFPDGLTVGEEYTITIKSGLIKSAKQWELKDDKSITFTATDALCDTSGINLVKYPNSAQSSVRITNNSPVSITPVLIMALYENNSGDNGFGGKLLDLELISETVEAEQTAELKTPILNAPDGIDSYHYKAFLWDGTETMRELTPFVQKKCSDASLFSLNPVADSYVHNGKYSQQNYGSEDKLYIKTGNTNYYRKAFLKFDLSLVKAPIKSAKLRLYGYNSKTNNDTVVKIYRVEDNDWQEDTITWSNAPSTAAYIGDIIVDATPRYHEIDVTGYISECISGDGFVSFGLIPTIVDNVYFNSKEADENNPELLIEY